MGDSKDRGWEFMTSEDFDGSDADGSWGYKNSDGSASYHGADGSWGYINSDGSGSYHGADGSWGYINTDGSATYHGADGSWGYKNSDGSGSYYGADDSSENEMDDENDSYFSSDSDADSDFNSDSGSVSDTEGDTVSSAVDVILNFIDLVVAIRNRKSSSSNGEDNSDSYEKDYKQQEEFKRYAEERQRQEMARIKKEKRKAFFKKHWKGILVATMIVVAVLAGTYIYREYSKRIPVGRPADSLINKDYEAITSILKGSGFTNVQTMALYDLSYENKDDCGLVAKVTISGSSSFDAEDKYPYDSLVVIKYHSMAIGSTPISAKEAKGEQYQEIVKAFESVGFGNIILSADYDLIMGWINGSGEIKSISIDGETSFEKNSQFAVDSRIEIVYHEFKKNNPDK